MITTEEFKNAETIVDKYNKELNLSLVKNYTCVCCQEKIITPVKNSNLEIGSLSYINHDQGQWNDGTVTKISFGYGSKFDGRSIYVGLCDDCTQNLIDKNIVTDLKDLGDQSRNYKK